MKKTILTFLLTTIITFSCLGRNDFLPLPTLVKKIDTIYMNRNWEAIPKGTKYSYFRTIEKRNDSIFLVKDYYESGQLQMSGAYKSATLEERVGKFTWYTEKGEQVHLFNYEKDKVSVKSYIYKFKAEFPKEPSVEIEKKGEVTACCFLCKDTITQTACGVFYVENRNNSSNKYEISTTLENLTDEWKKKMEKQYGKIIAEKEIEFKGYLGKEIIIETRVTKTILLLRFYLATNKFFGIIAGPYSVEDINNSASHFLNSFDIIDTTEWFQYKSNKHDFKIEFPNAPEYEIESNETRFGLVEMTSISFIDSISVTSNSLYFLISNEFPTLQIQSYMKDSSSYFFKHKIDDISKSIGKIIKEKEIEYKGYSGKEITVKRKKKKGYARLRLYLIENKFYVLGIFTKTKDSNNAIYRFFNSFDIIKDI